jgi:hypothetical protein
MSAAILGMFFLARLICGSFTAVMAMLLLASGPVGLVLTNNPNSHASAVFFVIWGMYFLFRWWRSGAAWQGALAGFLLGFAATIRYTEGLMLLPLLLAIMLKLRWRSARSYLRNLVPLVAWMVPVSYLVCFNLIALHSLTGYDSTNESTGFSWDHFSDKWNFAVGQLYWTGLYFVMPLASAGLVLAFRWNWRVAMALLAWIVPGSLLYMSYYYGLNMPLIGYLRFFTTLLPPAFLAAAWLLRQASLPDGFGKMPAGDYRSIAGPIAIGLFVSVVAISDFRSLLPSLERDQVIALNLADLGSRIRSVAPAGSVIFAPSQRLLNYLQFAGDYDLYGSDYFERASALPPAARERDRPTPFQAARQDFLSNAYKKFDTAGFKSAATGICRDALQANHRVFIILDGSTNQWCKMFLNATELQWHDVTHWQEPSTMSQEASRTLGALGGMGMVYGRRQGWTITEIKLKPAAPATTQAAVRAE